MAFITFDTYEHIERLKKAGLQEPQAKAIIDAVKLSHFDFATKHDLETLAQKLEHLATKDELNQLRLETREGFAQVDARFAQIDARFVQADNKIDSTAAAFELKLLSFKAEIIRWIVGLFFAQAGLLLALLKFAR